LAGRDARQLYVEIIGDDRQYSRTLKTATAETAHFERQLGKATRGVAAGSGVFRTMGRSIAFASGGFLAFAGVTDLIRGSVEQANQAEAVQRKLAAQFKASGQDLGLYQQRIDQATSSVSRLAGIEDDELKQAFITAFRGSNDVTTALRIQTIAADVARGRNIDLQTATLALTKAFAGQTTGLRRLGIVIPTAVKGMAALDYVGAKFRGQAEAGTTAQERFNAAFKNMEEIIGTALLPTINDLLGQMAKWLNNPDNQRKVQHAAEDTGKAIKTAGEATAKTAGEYVRWWNAAKHLNETITDFGRNLASDFTANMVGATKAVHDLGTEQIRLIGIMNQQPLTGEDVGLRGAGARTGTGPVAGGAGGKTSFQGQMNQLEVRLAEALTTVSRADDRSILVLQKHLIERWLAHTKDWKLRRQLYQQLASVQDQITSIDDDKAQVAQDAAEKEKEAKQKERDAEKKRLETHRDHIRKMRAAWQEQLAKIRQATEAVRSEFGQLPFQPTPAGILGVRGQTAGGVASAYATQTKTFVGFYNSLARIGRMGAPAGLVEQLRGLGPDATGLVQGLARHPRQLRSLIRSFQEREKVTQQIAHADIQARNVVIHMAGSRAGATSAASRRGRQAGVPTSIGSYIGN